MGKPTEDPDDFSGVGIDSCYFLFGSNDQFMLLSALRQVSPRVFATWLRNASISDCTGKNCDNGNNNNINNNINTSNNSNSNVDYKNLSF